MLSKNQLIFRKHFVTEYLILLKKHWKYLGKKENSYVIYYSFALSVNTQ